MIHYLISIIIFQLIFLIAYDLFHRKDTFFSLNRVYLLITSVLSFILPLVRIKSIQNTIPDEYIVNLPAVLIGQQSELNNASQILQTTTVSGNFSNLNWWLIIYGIGLTVACLSFINKNVKLYLLRKKSIITKIYNYNLVTVKNSSDAFSFWNTIYLGDQIHSEKEQIITHEIVHLKERHSIDLLWFEFLKILLWFNPLVYIYQSKINVLHEFIADAKSATVFGKRKYSEQLLNTGFDTEKIKFINQFFNHSLLKKRILMLQKPKSNKNMTIKYLIILPVFMIMIVFSSFSGKLSNTKTTSRSTLDNVNHIEKRITQISKDTIKDGIPFALIDKIPTTESCKGILNKVEMKKCVSNEIKEFVNTNFNVSEMKKYSEPGVNRIYVRFKIHKTGIITSVQARGPSPELEKEAIRVVKSIPKMIPGELNGEKVGVLYSLPIVFKNGSEDLSKSFEKKSIKTEPIILSDNLSDFKNHNVKLGYYLISNIYQRKSLLEKGLKKLQEQGLDPKVFQNPKDKYYYVYLKKSNDLETVKNMLTSNLDGNYEGDLYILKIHEG
ncbi:M56 family metallopeptidase [Aquimarina aggregata]|uniref:M56 family metallopeptidase n=1 Tax=Aquimarina aggregata TaxID=1642818 RepID=UPI002492A1D1|nr:M56 family metallopeptidase [Aquimarina aggregata]